MPEGNDPPPHDLTRLVHYCESNGVQLLVATDSNAHHPLWGMETPNDRVLSEENEKPSLKIMAISSVYNIGEKKGIFCKGKNVAEPIEWYSPSGDKVEAKSSINTRVYVEKRGNVPDVLGLIILSTKIKDSGNWTCKSGELSETIEIVVGEKVVMPVKYEKAETEENKSYKLSCIAKGNPQPAVQWYKIEAGVINEDPAKYIIRKKDDNYTLEIKKITHADAGEYMCKVTQEALSHYTHKTIQLSVHHKPILFNYETREIYPIAPPSKYRTEEVFAVMNYTKNITCSAIANPLPSFHWVRQKPGFNEPVPEEMIIASEDGMSSTMMLRMRDDNDKGLYKCTAKNAKGQVTVIFDVTPGEKPFAPDDINLSAANSTHLTFNVTCSNCTFMQEENAPVDSENLPVTGYTLQLVPHREHYPADWDQAQEFDVDITNPEDTLFSVGPLPNTTIFHVRVCSRNAAGFSDWTDMLALPSTTDHAIRLVATLALLFATLLFTAFY